MTHASQALVAAALRERVHHLECALATCRHIGMAVGILMARHHITDSDAFELLRSASQYTGRKLRDIADQVTLTGELPGRPQFVPAARGRHN